MTQQPQIQHRELAEHFIADFRSPWVPEETAANINDDFLIETSMLRGINIQPF